ncbi:hypothetical protein KRR38_35010 [Novosphingobium sp. G106]|uniref:hypothetical protein n=1 Tax=Novosphingobium sp. G106 TaxID=2849500 RepID=UPI001C2DEB5C|nr:hypothetical protein [Novosphingobium sp. G106]MBV1692705.1 hypothetical protein [Novosphingobium sp. G106]
MATWSPATARKSFAVFAALDLGALFALSSKALHEARQADPAGLLSLFIAMQAAAVCGLLLLTLWFLAAAVRAPIQSGMRWCRRHTSMRENSHVQG